MIIKIGVSGMSCGHCSMAVKKSLSALDGVDSVEVSLEDKTAIINASKELSADLLKETIEEEGYTFNGIL